MREILFRGKPFCSNEFIFGDLTTSPNGILFFITQKKEYSEYYMNDLPCVQVIPETVGQYTGIKDKNKIKIFEGDTIRCNHRYSGKSEGNFVIMWDSENARFDFRECNSPILANQFSDEFEIIGNIHEKGTG